VPYFHANTSESEGNGCQSIGQHEQRDIIRGPKLAEYARVPPLRHYIETVLVLIGSGIDENSTLSIIRHQSGMYIRLLL
jgi:hypothetical protein